MAGVASHFDVHVREQLPFYDLATQATTDIIRCFLQDRGVLLDIGASTGNVTRAASDVLAERGATAVSIEPAGAMVDVFDGVGELVRGRLEDVELPACDVAVSFLTLAFIPPRLRRAAVQKIMDAVHPGGAFVCVERVHHSGNQFVSRVLLSAAKLRRGASAEDVVKKEVSISGVLRPVDESVFIGLGAWLFFAYGDFRGYVVEKPE